MDHSGFKAALDFVCDLVHMDLGIRLRYKCKRVLKQRYNNQIAATSIITHDFLSNATVVGSFCGNNTEFRNKL